MENKVEVVGTIKFGKYLLDVYDSLDEPLFKARDVADILEYSEGNTWRMIDKCENDEVLKLPVVVAGQTRHINFLNEHGLYNVLAQSRKPIARGWRRVLNICEDQRAFTQGCNDCCPKCMDSIKKHIATLKEEAK